MHRLEIQFDLVLFEFYLCNLCNNVDVCDFREVTFVEFKKKETILSHDR